MKDNEISIRLYINGRETVVSAPPQRTLQEAIHDLLGLTGTKHMCGKGACGSCTVIMDGRAVLSCMILAVECDEAHITTAEGIAEDPAWKPLVDAYCKWDAMQCGYCTPGFIVSAKDLLDKNPDPTDKECYEALAGNICICGTYPRHAQAILEAALAITETKVKNG